jgi:hypothetical protein
MLAVLPLSAISWPDDSPHQLPVKRRLALCVAAEEEQYQCYFTQSITKILFLVLALPI